MKKVILIFCVLSLLIFIRPALGLGTNSHTNDNNTVITTQVDNSVQESVYEGAFSGIKKFYSYTGFANATFGNIIMILIADSGSTKCDWQAVDGKEKTLFTNTKGINPFFHDEATIESFILSNCELTQTAWTILDHQSE